MKNGRNVSRVDKLRSERKILSNKLAYYWTVFRSPATPPAMKKYIKEEIDSLSEYSRELAVQIRQQYNHNPYLWAIDYMLIPDHRLRNRLLRQIKTKELSPHQDMYYVDLSINNGDFSQTASVEVRTKNFSYMDDRVRDGTLQLLLCNPNL